MTQNNLSLAEDKVIPDGYKKTIVGVYPIDWEISQLKDIANFGGGTTPPRALYNRYYALDGHAWVKTLDLNNDKIYQTQECITDTALSEVAIKLHSQNTLLVAMYGGFNQIGRTGLLKVNAAINQALVAIKPISSILDSEFLQYNLNYRVEYWKSVASSSRKDPNITSNDVKAYTLALPNIKEQKNIATALSDTDALISELEKLIEKKQAIKTATMQQLLIGKTRLPEFALREDGTPKGYKEGELGKIPEDWEVNTIGNFVEITSGESPSKFEFITDGIPYFKVDQLNNGNFYAELTPYHVRSGKVVLAGSLIFPKRGASILSNKIRILKVDACMDTNLMALTCNKALDPNYLLYTLIYSGLAKVADTTSIPQINNKHIVPFPISYPSIEEQKEISNILMNLEHDIELSKNKVEKLRHIKLGMMQELLTGKTRLV